MVDVTAGTSWSLVPFWDFLGAGQAFNKVNI